MNAGALGLSCSAAYIESDMAESGKKDCNSSQIGFKAAGLTCAFTQSLSLQFLPFSQGSLLRTTPLSGVATGEGCDHLHTAFVHFNPNLQRVADSGRSGDTKA